MPVEFKDYYKVLGVGKNATEAEIKTAFRKLAMKHHPDVAKDKNAGDGKFKEINEAHEVLGDSVTRKRYDDLGANWQNDIPEQNSGSQRNNNRARNGDSQEFHFGGTGFSDFFEQFFSRGGSPSANSRAEESQDWQTNQSQVARRGQDINGDIWVTLEEVIQGVVRDVSVQSIDPQTGEKTMQTFKVKIPAGVQEHQVLRAIGKGGEGHGGAEAGSLYMRICFAPHTQFTLEGADLHSTIDVYPWEAVLGTKIQLPTLIGPVTIRVPQLSQNGQQLRVRGRGLPRLNGKLPGDLLAKINLRLPKTITDEERILWEKLALISNVRN